MHLIKLHLVVHVLSCSHVIYVTYVTHRRGSVWSVVQRWKGANVTWRSGPLPVSAECFPLNVQCVDMPVHTSTVTVCYCHSVHVLVYWMWKWNGQGISGAGCSVLCCPCQLGCTAVSCTAVSCFMYCYTLYIVYFSSLMLSVVLRGHSSPRTHFQIFKFSNFSTHFQTPCTRCMPGLNRPFNRIALCCLLNRTGYLWRCVNVCLAALCI